VIFGAGCCLRKIGSGAKAKELDYEAEPKPKSRKKLEPLPKKKSQRELAAGSQLLAINAEPAPKEPGA